MYLHNDSVDGAPPTDLRFFVTLASTHPEQLLQTVEVRGFPNIDVEDMTYGACPDGQGRCLYFADTGSNGNWRTSASGFKIAVVREEETFPSVVDPIQVIHFRYPEAAAAASERLNFGDPSSQDPNASPTSPYWDTEAMALQPSTGDLYFATKASENGKGAYVYRLRRERFSEPEPAVEFVAKLGFTNIAACRLGELNATFAKNCYRVTGLDFSPDGSRVLVLAYGVLMEFDRDFSQVLSLAMTDPDMPQAEAIAYDRHDPSQFYYTTEVRATPRLPGVSERPLRRLSVSDLR